VIINGKIIFLGTSGSSAPGSVVIFNGTSWSNINTQTHIDLHKSGYIDYTVFNNQVYLVYQYLIDPVTYLSGYKIFKISSDFTSLVPVLFNDSDTVLDEYSQVSYNIDEYTRKYTLLFCNKTAI
jgi:hypothetical protein